VAGSSSSTSTKWLAIASVPTSLRGKQSIHKHQPTNDSLIIQPTSPVYRLALQSCNSGSGEGSLSEAFSFIKKLNTQPASDSTTSPGRQLACQARQFTVPSLPRRRQTPKSTQVDGLTSSSTSRGTIAIQQWSPNQFYCLIGLFFFLHSLAILTT
jgi:hypothetical protein